MSNITRERQSDGSTDRPAAKSSTAEVTRKDLSLFGPLGMIALLSLVMLIQAPHFFRWPNMSAVLVDASLFVVLLGGSKPKDTPEHDSRN